jgi:hypothetical protein
MKHPVLQFTEISKLIFLNNLNRLVRVRPYFRITAVHFAHAHYPCALCDTLNRDYCLSYNSRTDLYSRN